MKNKRIFISGGAGVIGKELVKKLVFLGNDVFVGDLKPKPKSFSENIKYWEGDLNFIAKDEITSFKPEVFIHLAATFERSIEKYSFWEENYTHNIKLSHYLMTILKDTEGLKRVIFASSYLIYNPYLYQFDKPCKSPYSLTEKDPINPRNLTGMAKLNHEKELDFINSFLKNKISLISVRIFRGYGLDSRDIISRWIRELIKGKAISVFRPEGIFDYIFANDTATGLIKIATNYDLRGVVNLGTGKSRSVQDVLEILRVYFPKMKIRSEKSNIKYESSQANIDKLYKNINWKPVYQIEDGIKEIIEYEKNQIKAKINSDKEKIKKRTFSILITSSSRKVPLVEAVKTAVKKISDSITVICADANNHSVTKYIVNDFWNMENLNKYSKTEILKECKKRNIKIILPTRDGELKFWSQIAPFLLKNKVNVIISSPEAIEVCQDKKKFSDFGLKNGFSFIPSFLNPSKLKEEKVVIKERFGSGSKGIIFSNNNDVQSLSESLINPIFQPQIFGKEISVDAWFDNNKKIKGLVLRERVFVDNGESQITKTFRNKFLETQLTKILSKLNLKGPVVLQAIIDKRNNLYIIECNPRFGGASTASILVGLDVFKWSILEAMGKSLKDHPFNRLRKEVTQIRIPKDVYHYDYSL